MGDLLIVGRRFVPSALSEDKDLGEDGAPAKLCSADVTNRGWGDLIGMRLIAKQAWILFSCALLLVCLVGARHSDVALAAVDQGLVRRPVLVELFTSEGCSSCPPADALLAKLDAGQPVNGAEVIVLSEHVTYWDRLGWKDPYSLEAMTERQQWYSRKFGLDGVYTPQVVVDGVAEMVGNDEREVQAAVHEAAGSARGQLSIDGVQWLGDRVIFNAKAVGIGGETKIMAVLAEDSVQSSVASGENAGRKLRHVAVVRTMQEIGSSWRDGRALTLPYPGAVGKGGTGSIRLVLFVVEKKTGRVVTAVEQTVARSS